MDELALRQLIGRLASHQGPPRGWGEQQGQQSEELLIVPVLPSDSLNESVERIRASGHVRGFLTTAWWQHGSGRPLLAWLAVEMVGASQHPSDSHLPTTPSTTVGDLLRILHPGASMTVRLESDELVLQPAASPEPIANEQAVESLRELAPA
ncbi:MAG: hypothetical protein F4Y05_04355 [Acidimicrobiaceae bacterium]|nr:hypothetical protein [Acidimicrobiaceae bacterium]MYE08817.1 hypothetical protein [Acidimicrobiaceae bacterium]MYI36678.1 hypothetical protein [Acidimicrobiaceae bacterium]